MSDHEFTFRTYLASLIDTLRWSGTSVLEEMEKAGEITNEQRRALQYDFVSGINDAHLAMHDPQAALRCHERSFRDGQVKVRIEQGIHSAVEKWLEYVLGVEWRTADINTVQFPPSVGWLRKHLMAIRKALMAKPSKIIEQLPVRDVPKCSRCHMPGHMGRDCPFNANPKSGAIK